MRPFWKGFIAFGLVSIPVKLYPATETKSIGFTLLHKKDGAPIRYKKFCEKCETEVGQEEIVKGYEFSKGKYVTFTEEELEKIAQVKGKQIEITDFVDLKEIDPIYFQRSYYLSPGEGGEKPYALLVSALNECNRIAIAKIVLRTKESIAMVRVFNNKILALSTVYYPDEIRNPNTLDVPENIELNEMEQNMAKMLIENLTHKFDPQRYTDTYRKALHEIIERKILNQEIEIKPEAVPENVVDLTEALRLSLEKIKGEKPVKSEAKDGKNKFESNAS